MKDFELVQVHENHSDAEVIIRDKNGFMVYGGKLKKIDEPKAYYPPDNMSSDRWFILVDHVFPFDIERGTIVTDVYLEDDGWRFEWKGKKYTTYYGWGGLARETEENRNIAIRYWKLVDASEAIKMANDILFTNIEKAQKYNAGRHLSDG